MIVILMIVMMVIYGDGCGSCDDGLDTDECNMIVSLMMVILMMFLIMIILKVIIAMIIVVDMMLIVVL